MPNTPQGQLDPHRWITEGDGLHVSARAIRTEWNLHRREIRSKVPQRPSLNSYHWSKLYGFPRAAVLLLGYSVEMYLKAGLAKVYRGCCSKMFNRDVKGFGHDYVRLAAATEFPQEEGDEGNLKLMQDFVLQSSRYPLFPNEKIAPNSPDRFNKMNEINGTIWSKEQFSKMLDLAKRIRNHSTSIDQDSQNTCSYSGHVPFGTDGYLSARSGGRLSPRITFRYSKEMKGEGKATPEAIRAMFASDNWTTAGRIWDSATLIEDGEKSIVIKGQLEAAPHLKPAKTPKSDNPNQE